MPIESAVGTASGSSSVTAQGSIRPQGVATPTRAAFVQEEFRSIVWQSTDVKNAYGKVAQDTKDEPIATFFDNEFDCYAIAKERGEIMGSHGRLFRVVVGQILTEEELSFATTLPGAHLVDEELVADLDVAVASIESIDFNSGQTVLKVWGRVGSVPVSDDRLKASPGSAGGTSSALGVGVTIKEAVGASSGSSSGSTTGTMISEAVGAASGSGAATGDAWEEFVVLLAGDMQDGTTDGVALAGDMQSGSDVEAGGD